MTRHAFDHLYSALKLPLRQKQEVQCSLRPSLRVIAGRRFRAKPICLGERLHLWSKESDTDNCAQVFMCLAKHGCGTRLQLRPALVWCLVAQRNFTSGHS
jgi:hypothetical protein